jgi:hypothetical protein
MSLPQVYNRKVDSIWFTHHPYIPISGHTMQGGGRFSTLAYVDSWKTSFSVSCDVYPNIFIESGDSM